MNKMIKVKETTWSLLKDIRDIERKKQDKTLTLGATIRHLCLIYLKEDLKNND